MLPLVLTLALLCSLGSAQTINDCPAGIIKDKYLQVHGGFCFEFLVEYPLDWNTASEDCRVRGGTLALPKTKALSDYLIDSLIYSYGSGLQIWIGLSDKAKEGTFQWEDGTPLLATDYQNWPQGVNGTNPNRDCVCLDPSRSGQWAEDSCSDTLFGLILHERPYVCQYRARASSVSPTPA